MDEGSAFQQPAGTAQRRARTTVTRNFQVSKCPYNLPRWIEKYLFVDGSVFCV